MIKIYGMPTCPYCDYIHEQIKGRENEFEYINIGENIRNMSAFTRLRDADSIARRLYWKIRLFDYWRRFLTGWENDENTDYQR